MDSVCHLLQSPPDRFLTRCPPSDHPADFPKSITLYYCTLTRGTLLSCDHHPDIIYGYARLEHCERARQNLPTANLEKLFRDSSPHAPAFPGRRNDRCHTAIGRSRVHNAASAIGPRWRLPA